MNGKSYCDSFLSGIIQGDKRDFIYGLKHFRLKLVYKIKWSFWVITPCIKTDKPLMVYIISHAI